jgi:glycine cleavage system H protein
VDGEIIEVNTTLPDHLETLSEDPYDAGWIVKIRISDEGRLTELLDYERYQQQCAAEG